MLKQDAAPANDDCFFPGHIVVTGGAGFIGSHLVDRLLRTYQSARITVYDAFTYAGNLENLAAARQTNRLKIVNNCVLDKASLAVACKGADAVFHLAAESHVPRSFADPELFDRVNRVGSLNVASIAATEGVKRLVHVSTDEVYGPSDSPLTECAELRPTTPYAISKAKAEDAVMGVVGLDLRIARPVNAIGPRQHIEKLIPKFVDLALTGLPFTIEGSGTQRRNFISVDDLARALISIMNARPGCDMVFNVPGPDVVSIMEAARHIADALGTIPSFSHVDDRPINDAVYAVDGRALHKTGHVNQFCFEEEVHRVIQHARQHRSKVSIAKRKDIGLSAPTLVPASDAVAEPADNWIRFHKSWKPESDSSNILSVLRSGRLFGGGPMTARVETAMSSATGAKRAWMTHSCTGAMEVAALALGIEPGDEVIVPTYTFCATATAFERAGAKLLFADIDAADFMLSYESVRSRITSRTKAIVPVHYGGVVKDLTALVQLADSLGIHIVEDAAQAVGATLAAKAAGTAGIIGCYSFHETKVFSCGHGGMLLLNRDDPDVENRIDAVMHRGTNYTFFRQEKLDHYEWITRGGSYQTSEIQAAMLADVMPHMADIIGKRRSISQAYGRCIEACGLSFRRLGTSESRSGNHHIEAIVMESEDDAKDLIAWLCNQKIEAQSHYKPLHLSRRGALLDPLAKCPVADNLWNRIVRLPIHTRMSLADVERVVLELVRWKTHKEKGIRLQRRTVALPG